MDSPGSASSFNLDNTMGAMLVAVIISSCLFGCTCVQTYTYFRNFRDPVHVKMVVTVVWVLEAVHISLGMHALYYWLVKYYGNPEGLLHPPWSSLVTIGVVISVALVVIVFYAHRVYCVSGGNKWLPPLIVVIGLAQSVITWLDVGLCLKQDNVFNILEVGHKYGPIGLSLGVAADTTIAVSLCYYLHKSRTGMRRTDTMINRLMVYIINNGILTSVVNIVAVGFVVHQPDNLIYFGITQVLGNCYVISFLATLNARAPSHSRPQIGFNSVELSSHATPSASRRRSRSEIFITQSTLEVVDPPYSDRKIREDGENDSRV